MTRKEAITIYIVPAIQRTWNDKKCKEILETLEQDPKKGRWKKTEVRGNDSLICSECFADLGSIYPENYCPNCGAKMESEG